MRVFGAIIRVLIGAVFGLCSAIALIPAFAAFSSGPESSGSPLLVLLVIGLGAVLGFFAPGMRRTFGRGFLMLGICVLALPLSTMLLSGRVSGDLVTNAAADERAAAAIGSGIAATAMTGAAAIIGFFLGGILLVVGLVLALGGKREVVVVNR